MPYLAVGVTVHILHMPTLLIHDREIPILHIQTLGIDELGVPQLRQNPEAHYKHFRQLNQGHKHRLQPEINSTIQYSFSEIILRHNHRIRTLKNIIVLALLM